MSGTGGFDPFGVPGQNKQDNVGPLTAGVANIRVQGTARCMARRQAVPWAIAGVQRLSVVSLDRRACDCIRRLFVKDFSLHNRQLSRPDCASSVTAARVRSIGHVGWLHGQRQCCLCARMVAFRCLVCATVFWRFPAAPVILFRHAAGVCRE